MWKTISMQDPASPIMEQLIMFHDHTMMIIVMITVTVGYMMTSLFFNKITNRFLFEGQMIELVWTMLPAMVLIFIALPSLRILYLMEEMSNPLITIKAIGHQWFWSYEYSDFKKIEFDSYMKPTTELTKNEFRLLDTDNRIVLPFNTNTRILVTSTDVIHSWTIPSLGIKIDASPGRINQGNLLINRSGLFFGQCSEICGANHSFMPIVMESINMKTFYEWVSKF
uniref:cytochrome c oxidase subunit II n=1 Tax=Bothrogonia lata TaxID=1030432 RepID=UPI0023F5392A|nr:cytochrome c oxidase subunit II [Bothrogonia lata]WDZ68104.1 cytochrome c oxidase subunit II [Bothrogonia lata]WRQ18434.1 cytochrome c oxidase subunit II [Bothrogonia sp. 1 XLX-2024a]